VPVTVKPEPVTVVPETPSAVVPPPYQPPVFIYTGFVGNGKHFSSSQNGIPGPGKIGRPYPRPTLNLILTE